MFGMLVVIFVLALGALLYVAMMRNPDLKAKLGAAAAAAAVAAAAFWEQIQGWWPG